jgi:hypothetical protein
MDDFLLLTADRREARERLDEVRAFLTEQLRLELNLRRVVVAPIGEPCDLLGYVHHADDRIRVRRRSVRRLWRRLPALERRVAAHEIDSGMARASVASWIGLAKHADAFRLSKSIFTQRDVENVGKRLLVQSLWCAARRSTADRWPNRALQAGARKERAAKRTR